MDLLATPRKKAKDAFSVTWQELLRTMEEHYQNLTC